jgi:hypothetical protein
MDGERNTVTVLMPIGEAAANLVSQKASDGKSALLAARVVWLT